MADITDVDQFDDPATTPADGDAVDAATMLLHLQKLANRTRFLYNRTQVGSVFVPLVEPATKGANMTFEDTPNYRWIDGNNVGDISTWHVQTPPVGRITLVTVVSEGVGHSALPATPPQVELIRLDGGVATVVATFSDSAATFGDMDTKHTWTSAALTEDIAATTNYLVRLTGESSTNSQTDHRYYSIALTIAPTP